MNEIKPNEGDMFTSDNNQRELMLSAIQNRTEGHCPCVPKSFRSDDTLCPCLKYRSGEGCMCGLFVKGGVNENNN